MTYYDHSLAQYAFFRYDVRNGFQCAAVLRTSMMKELETVASTDVYKRQTFER